jgi:hypothetical protein
MRLRARPPLRLLGMGRTLLGPYTSCLRAALCNRGTNSLALLFREYFLINLFGIRHFNS